MVSRLSQLSLRTKVILGVVAIPILCCCGLFGISLTQTMTPAGRATSTARAAELEVTATARVVERTQEAMAEATAEAVEATEEARPTEIIQPTQEEATETAEPTIRPATATRPRATATDEPTETVEPTETAVPTQPAPTATVIVGPRVIITGVNKQQEYVDLANIGSEAQDLAGWRLVSETGPQECSLSGVIAAGGSLRVWAMAEDAGQGGFNCGFGTNIWNNDEPDPAVLYDAAGNEVSRR